MRKSLWIALGVTVGLVIIVSIIGGSKAPSTYSQEKSSVEPAAPEKPDFTMNTKEKDAIANGNMITCIKAFDYAANKGATLDAVPETTTIQQISKQPYSFLGKRFVIRAKIHKIEQNPPDVTGSPNPWTEILLLAKNRNSNFGSSNIEFVYNGDITKIDAKDYIDLNGFFVGTFTAQNAFGADLEGYMFVGNSLKMVQKYGQYY